MRGGRSFVGSELACSIGSHRFCTRCVIPWPRSGARNPDTQVRKDETEPDRLRAELSAFLNSGLRCAATE